jgi:hypothetical protein
MDPKSRGGMRIAVITAKVGIKVLESIPKTPMLCFQMDQDAPNSHVNTDAKYNAPARDKEIRPAIIIQWCEDYTQSPESICSAGCFESYQASQALQFGEILLRSMCLLISDPLSKNCTASPAPTCQAYQMLTMTSLRVLRDTYNMAMHKPSPRIIRLESNNQPSSRRKHSDIPPCRISEVQTCDISGCELACISGRGAKEVEIVAVEMDGMWNWWSSLGCVPLNNPV